MTVIYTKYSYQDFWEAVKKRLGSNLAAFKLTDEQLVQYMNDPFSKHEIESGFSLYQTGFPESTQTEDQKFWSDVCGTAYCLEMCY